MRTVFISLHLSWIGLSGRNDPYPVIPWCVDQHVQTAFDTTEQFVAVFAIAEPVDM